MRYLQLATSYELPPAMVLTCGLPASGKSWLARHLARPLRAAVVHSDVRRKVLSGLQPATRVKADYESGLYSPEMKRETYRSLLTGALDTLGSGQSVVVDATFSEREYRTPFVDAAARMGLPYFVVHVTAADETIRERLALRKHDAHEASDADLAVYLQARESFEPPDEVPPRHVVSVESGQALAEEQSSLVLDHMIALAGYRWDDPLATSRHGQP